jgi:hypothetical protein
VVIPRPELRDRLLINIQQQKNQNNYQFILQKDTNIFQLSESFSKILIFKKKSLPAFVHEEFSLSSVRFSLNQLFLLTSPPPPSTPPPDLSLSSSSHNSSSTPLPLRVIYLVNSTVMAIKPYDQLQKLFPCSRSLLIAHPITTTLNFYLLKFFPQSYILRQKDRWDPFMDWLSSWLT